MVPLELALFGHPEAGSIWEDHSEDKFTNHCDWESHAQFNSVFRHPETDSIMTSYVDDFEIEALPEVSKILWKDIEKHIQFKYQPEYWEDQGVQHLGCRHKVTRIKDKDGHMTTTYTSDMTKYVENMCNNFEDKFGVKLKGAATPFLI